MAFDFKYTVLGTTELFRGIHKPIGAQFAFGDFGKLGQCQGTLQVAPSATITKGDALKFDTRGRLTGCGTTDKAIYVAKESATAGSADFTFCNVEPTGLGLSIFQVGFTPLINNVAVGSATTTSVTFTMSAGSSNDLRGGLIYIVETDETHVIDSNTYSGGNVTVNTTEPFGWTSANTSGTAPTTANTVRLVPFGYLTTALQFASASTISNTIAGASSGNISVWDVDMKNGLAHVRFNP